MSVTLSKRDPKSATADLMVKTSSVKSLVGGLQPTDGRGGQMHRYPSWVEIDFTAS